jgi:hypothetical protein
VEVSLLHFRAISVGCVKFFFWPLTAVLVVADVGEEFLFLSLVCEGEFHPGGGWLYRDVGLAVSVGFVFRPLASWPAVTDSVFVFQVCFVGGRCVFNVQVFVYRCGVGNDSCGPSNVWRLRATGKVDL